MSNYQLVKNTEWKEVEINGEDTEIPTHWNVKNVSQLIDAKNGFPFKGDDFSQEKTNYPLIRIRDLLDQQIQTYYKGTPNNKMQIIKNGDLLVGMDGDFNIVEWKKEDVLLNQRILKLESKDVNNKGFIKNVLSILLNDIHRKTLATTVKHLSSVDFLNKNVITPSEKEQSSIASILSEQESIIQDIESLISKYESRFQYLSDELLSGRLRVKEVDGEVVLYKNPEDNWKEVEINGEMKEIPKDWEVVTLKDFGFVKTSSVDKKIKDNEQIVDLFNYMDVYRSTTKLVDKNIKFTKTSIKPHVLEDNYIRKGDVFFTPSSETEDDIGYSATAIEDIPNAVYSYHLIRFRPTKYILDESFSGKIFNTKLCRDYFTEKCNGLTRMTLKKGDFEELQISIPLDVEEQKKIYSVILIQEEIIEKEKTLLQKEKQKFDWLLDNLLSGKYLVRE